MDRLNHIASEAENRFLDISPQNSPRPQASSTLMVKGNESDFISKTPKKPESSTLFSTTSSLGVIDIDKASLLSEKEFDTWSPQQSTPFHERLISEYQSQSLNQLKKRLDELSFRNSSFSSESVQNVPGTSNETYNISNNVFRDNLRSSTSSSNQLVTSSSSQNGEFQSGNLAVLKLDEDQKENRKMFASLPVSPMNISENSLESCDEKEKQFSEFVQMKCYPPEDISQILRNKIDQTFEERKKANEQKHVSSTTDTNQSSKDLPTVPKLQPCQSETFQRLLQHSFMDTSSFSSTLDMSSSNSIASINEIAELLKRQSLLAMPKRAVEELLSLGKPKSKPANVVPCPSNPSLDIPYISLSEFSSRNTTLISASESFNLRGKPSENIMSSTVRDDVASNIVNREILQKTSPVKNIDATLSNNADSSKRLFSIKLPSNSTTEIATTPEDHLARDFIDLNAISDEPSTNDTTARQNNLKAAPMQRISNHSLLSADVLENDVIFAGTLCVGTLAEVICVVENPTDEPLNYKIRLQSIVSTAGVSSGYPAASVMLASTQDHVVFQPRSETDINVMVTPLVEGKIRVTLQLISDDKKCSNIIRLIEVIGEMPKFRILEPRNGVAQFGVLNETTNKSLPLILQNDGTSKLPLKLMLYETDRNPVCSKVVVNPGETLRGEIHLNTSHLMTFNSDKLRLDGKLIVFLDKTEGIPLKLPLIETILLTAEIMRNDFIVIDNELPIVLRSGSVLQSVVEFLNVRNNGPKPVDVYAEIDKSSEFSIEPKCIQVSSQESRTFEVTFKPNSINNSRDADLYLTVKNTNKRIPVRLIGIVDNKPAPLSTVNSPARSRNQSYKSITSSGSSSTGSSVAYDGIMELDSTHSSLSWASVSIHTRKIQTFTLRNRSPSKEKLLLTISDSFNFFKFVENESYVKELRLTLESKESRKISVAFTPAVSDKPINGKITIVRRNVLLESSLGDFQKRVIPLFGVGGSVKMVFNGVFHDNEDRLWINCESQSFETKFILENVGDAEAFVKITSDELDDRIHPDECTLLPSESVEINYNLNLSTDRLDMLCKQNSHKEVTLVNKLTVYSGNESNRLRLKKIWNKHPEFDKIQKIRDKMDILNFDSTSRLQIDSLRDDKTVFSKLLYESVTEHTIGVLIPRQNLENVSLDSTVIFQDLNNFTIDHAFNC
ncbi:uncharacterized protein LOC135837414 [Planococcus citri]|uniref:uncharacterized protein LOC135837414 n=1 Tax=Planococcus citri TaxID=170843 RepID=UPI0031F85B23